MGEARHTPGPWTLTRGLTVYKRGEFGSERIIADMGWGPTDAQGVADAHLIAAAPDLLEAAQKALALLKKGAPGWGVAKDLLGAAIAKASPAFNAIPKE